MATTNVPDTQETGKKETKMESGSYLLHKDGYSLLPEVWQAQDELRTFQVKPGDVWVATYPKSGTTWMQELTWMLTHNLDYEAAKTNLHQRSTTTIETSMCPVMHKPNEPKSLKEFEERASRIEGRRVIKTHLPWELLPEQLRDPNSKGKIVHVTRNPKDVCVSFYYYTFLHKRATPSKMPTLEQFCKIFMTDKIINGPYWTYIQRYWDHRDNPNVLIVRFEQMKEDLEKVIQKVASFLEVPIPTGEEMTKFLHHLSFESMKKNPAVNGESTFPSAEELKTDNPEIGKFFRKGVVGDGKKKMSPEMVKEFDEWIKTNAERIGMSWENLV